jgi:hypothetical protein
MVNLEQDFIKFETNGELAYYGYTNNLDALDDDNVWSIRLLSGTGSTFYSQWSNNSKLNYISKWSEKEDYFLFNESDTFNISHTTSDSSFEGFYILDVEWNDLPGYDIYNIYIKNNNGKLVNKNNIEIHNIWADVASEIIISKGTNTLSYRFYAPVGLTYSFTLEASNIGGKLSETFNFTDSE